MLTKTGFPFRFRPVIWLLASVHLRKMRISHDGKVLTLHVDPSCASLVDSHARRRFQQLAQSANLVPQIEGA